MEELEPGFELSIQPGQFVLQPRRWRLERSRAGGVIPGGAASEGTVTQLVIKRRSRARDVSLQLNRPPLTEKEVSVNISGVIGIYTMLVDDYLGVVLGATKVGTVKKHAIYKVTKVVLLPFDGDALLALQTAQAYWRSNNETARFVEQGKPLPMEQRMETPPPRRSITLGSSMLGGSMLGGSMLGGSMLGGGMLGGGSMSSDTLIQPTSSASHLSNLSIAGGSSTNLNKLVATKSTTLPAANSGILSVPAGSTVVGRGRAILTPGASGSGFAGTTPRRPQSVHDGSNFAAVDDRAVGEIIRFFDTGGFYFSYGYDLTNTLQRQPYGSNPIRLRLDKVLDTRFWWNATALVDFVRASLQRYMLPLIQGYVSIETCEMWGEKFDFILMSRRSRFRAGLRYERRGVDQDGNVANMVETEQMVVYEGQHASFVQVRGSIPVFWSQPANRLHPRPQLNETETNNEDAMRRHFEDLLGKYGPQYIINLINQNGREAIVGSAFKGYLQRLPFVDIKYTAFDFHEMCKGFRYENVNYLIQELKEVFNSMFFCWESSPIPPMTRMERETLKMVHKAERAAILAETQGTTAAKLVERSILHVSHSTPTIFSSAASPPMATTTNGKTTVASDKKDRSKPAAPATGTEKKETPPPFLSTARFSSTFASVKNMTFRSATPPVHPTTAATTSPPPASVTASALTHHFQDTEIIPTKIDESQPFTPGHRRVASTGSAPIIVADANITRPRSASNISTTTNSSANSTISNSSSQEGEKTSVVPTGLPAVMSETISSHIVGDIAVAVMPSNAAPASSLSAPIATVAPPTTQHQSLAQAGRPRSNTDGSTYNKRLEVQRLSQQRGVFRVNCMDCLDRTNVVQSAIARQMINIMLTKMGVQINPAEGIKSYRDFDTRFNNAWANNGDEISKQYAGTGALKSDFTRTGRRTGTGMMSDGVNSLTRLYKNNFKDRDRQIIIDFLLGNHTAEAFMQQMNALPIIDPEPVKKLYTDAVRFCKGIILPKSEHMSEGWVLFFEPRPDEWPLIQQERVILFTSSAYYLVHYDFASDRVILFDRVDFRDIQQITYGVNRPRLTRALSEGQASSTESLPSQTSLSDSRSSPLSKSVDNKPNKDADTPEKPQSKSAPSSRSTSPAPEDDDAGAVRGGGHTRDYSDGGSVTGIALDKLPRTVSRSDTSDGLFAQHYCLKIDYRSHMVRYSADTTSMWSNPLLGGENHTDLTTASAAQLRELERVHNKPGSHFLSIKPRTATLPESMELSPKDQEGDLQSMVAKLKLMCPQAVFVGF